MDIKINNEDANELRNIFGRLSNTLDQFILPQNVATDNICVKFNAYNIQNVLKEENDLVTNCRKLKHLFSTPEDQSSQSTHADIHDKQGFDAGVARTLLRNHCVDTLSYLDREPEKIEIEMISRQDTYEDPKNSDTENSSSSTQVESMVNKENQSDLHVTQKSKDYEDILDADVHDRQVFEAGVARTLVRNHCVDTLSYLEREPEKNEFEMISRQDTYELSENSHTENSSSLTVYHENQPELRESQESKEDEDILDLMPSELDYCDYNSPDDAADILSDPVDNVTTNISLVQDEGKCENNDNLININDPNLNVQKTLNDDLKRFCFSYLKTKPCVHPKCKFIHKFPSTEIMRKILENLFNERFYDLVNTRSLRRRYGDCFAKEFSRRHSIKHLLIIMIEFLKRWPKDNITNRIIDTTLNYFKNNDINIEINKYLLTNISPKRQVYMVLIERVLGSKIKSEDDFKSFKQVCLLLTNFINNYGGEVNISITETFIKKICNVKYSQSLAIALVNMMRNTNTKIFENSAIDRLEEVMKRDECVYKQYLQLKEEARKKNDDVKNNHNGSQVQNEVSEVTSSSESNGLQHSNVNYQPLNTFEDCVSSSTFSKSENLSDSTRSNDLTNSVRDEETKISDNVCRNPHETPRKDQQMTETQKKSREIIHCLYYITDSCTRQDCRYQHTLPDLENFKILLEKTQDKFFFVLIKHQETVIRYGECLAQTFYERNSTEQLIMLAVKCLELSAINSDTKTEVLNITLRYINKLEINVREKLQLNFKVQKKSFQFLLLEHLLSHETSAELTKALIFLIDSMCANNEPFNYLMAESILRKVCSSYSNNLGRAFIKVIPLTSPKIFKHRLIPFFERLLTDKGLREDYKVLKTPDDTAVPVQEDNETACTSRAIVPPKPRRTSNPDEELAKTESLPRSRPAASIRGRRHSTHPQVVQTTPGDEVPHVPHRKTRQKIHPCTWAHLVGDSNSKP